MINKMKTAHIRLIKTEKKARENWIKNLEE